MEVGRHLGDDPTTTSQFPTHIRSETALSRKLSRSIG